jgi:hypothetical protein
VQPVSISSSALLQRQPMPEAVLSHFGSVEGFVKAVPGLCWDVKAGRVSLNFDFHRRLIGAPGP